MMTDPPVTAPTQQENPAVLKAYTELFQTKHAYAVSRVARCKDLMSRKSAKRWSAEKVALMVRRLVAAETMATQTEQVLDQLKFRTQQGS